MNDTSKSFFVDIPELDATEAPVLSEDIATEAELDHLNAVDRVFEELEASLFRLDAMEQAFGGHVRARVNAGIRRQP